MHHGLLLFPCEVEMGWGRPANHRCPPNTLVPALRNLLVTTPAILSGRRIAGDECIHEAAPGGEDEVSGDGSDVLEEAGARTFCLAGLLPEGFQAIVCGMEGEGQEIH